MQNKQKKISLMALQREYLEKTISKIDEMVAFSEDINSISDESLLSEYMQQIAIIEKEADENYRIACDIEKMIKR